MSKRIVFEIASPCCSILWQHLTKNIMTNPLGQSPSPSSESATAPISELDILYTTITKLADAQTSSEVLNAVADYPRSSGAVAGTLAYIRTGSNGTPDSWEVAAEWGNTSTYPN